MTFKLDLKIGSAAQTFEWTVLFVLETKLDLKPGSYTLSSFWRDMPQLGKVSSLFVIYETAADATLNVF